MVRAASHLLFQKDCSLLFTYRFSMAVIAATLRRKLHSSIKGAFPTRILELLCISLLLLPVSVLAQSVQNTQNSADSALRSGMRVDPSTLGLSFQLSLGSYPGRAGTSLP